MLREPAASLTRPATVIRVAKLSRSPPARIAASTSPCTLSAMTSPAFCVAAAAVANWALAAVDAAAASCADSAEVVAPAAAPERTDRLISSVTSASVAARRPPAADVNAAWYSAT